MSKATNRKSHQNLQEQDLAQTSDESMSIEDGLPPANHTETKLFYGIQYWVSIDPQQCQFTVAIGQGINLIEEVVICEKNDSMDNKELFRLAHEHAQKIINTEGADALAVRFGLQS
jgi:hypothetical protein